MTINQLLNCSIEKLEAMSDEALENELGHYFQVTRPEYQPKKEHRAAASSNPVATMKRMKALSVLDAMGIKL